MKFSFSKDYLETKRLAFPRLFFLSNEDLLDILSHSKDANCVQVCGVIPFNKKSFFEIIF
jgi:dynein heavy chain